MIHVLGGTFFGGEFSFEKVCDLFFKPKFGVVFVENTKKNPDIFAVIHEIRATGSRGVGTSGARKQTHPRSAAAAAAAPFLLLRPPSWSCFVFIRLQSDVMDEGKTLCLVVTYIPNNILYLIVCL